VLFRAGRANIDRVRRVRFSGARVGRRASLLGVGLSGAAALTFLGRGGGDWRVRSPRGLAAASGV